MSLELSKEAIKKQKHRNSWSVSQFTLILSTHKNCTYMWSVVKKVMKKTNAQGWSNSPC